jgi:threonylcarbamoyladenosine tRNA methylthiotransferase MtaB
LGCRLNFCENAELAARLRADGDLLVFDPAEAHTVVLNTCAVTEEATRKTRQEVRRLHRLNPSARIVLIGCWAELSPQQAGQMPGVALVVGNQQKFDLPALLKPLRGDYDEVDAARSVATDKNAQERPVDKPGAFQQRRSSAVVDVEAELTIGAPDDEEGFLGRTRALVRVQDGCDGGCAYCIVRKLRGPARSRSPVEVLEEVKRLRAAGFMEVVLTGVHVSAYGRDFHAGPIRSLNDLIVLLLTETDLPRLRTGSLEPWDLGEDFFKLWPRFSGRFCPHLHLSLQAGTDKQLRAMGRPYSTADFSRIAQQARHAEPNLTLTTDLIAGFPGESDADFRVGAEFIAALRFAHAHVFPYSPRPGTPAADFEGQIADDIKRARAKILRSIVWETGKTERLRFLGTVRSVLWENPRRLPPASEDNRELREWSGFTDNGLRTFTHAPLEADLTNRITSAQLAELRERRFFSRVQRS